MGVVVAVVVVKVAVVTGGAKGNGLAVEYKTGMIIGKMLCCSDQQWEKRVGGNFSQQAHPPPSCMPPRP